MQSQQTLLNILEIIVFYENKCKLICEHKVAKKYTDLQ